MAENPLLALPHSTADRERVEAELLLAVEAPTAAMTEMAGHLLGAGGKRVRPLFAIAAAHAAQLAWEAWRGRRVTRWRIGLAAWQAGGILLIGAWALRLAGML